MPHKLQYLPLILVVALILGAAIFHIVSPGVPGKNAPGKHADSGAFPVTITDARGKKVTIARAPEKIVSLAPNITEMLFALGAGERVIADTTYCDYPEAAAKLPKIGGYIDPNLEKILALSPDLVVGARGNAREVLERLEKLGVPVFAVDPVTVANVEEAIILVGKAVGRLEKAEALRDDMVARRKAVEAISASIPEAQRPRVLFIFSSDGLFSVGKGTYLHDLITRAGGNNIAAAVNNEWPQLSLEWVLKQDPEVIISLDGESVMGSADAGETLARWRKDARWKTMSAVKTGRVVFLPDDELTIPGPRLIDGLEGLARACHPERYAEEGQ